MEENTYIRPVTVQLPGSIAVDAHPVIIVTKNIKIIFEIKFFIIFIVLTILKHRN